MQRRWADGVRCRQGVESQPSWKRTSAPENLSDASMGWTTKGVNSSEKQPVDCDANDLRCNDGWADNASASADQVAQLFPRWRCRSQGCLQCTGRARASGTAFRVIARCFSFSQSCFFSVKNDVVLEWTSFQRKEEVVT